jgi:protein phosphatase
MWRFNEKRKIAGIPKGRLMIRAMTVSDTGCVRQNNEDSAGFKFLFGGKTDFVAVLADGMGGYERGEVASGMMVDTVFSDSDKAGKIHPLKWLENVVEKANYDIYETSTRSHLVMGTTCTILLVLKKKLFCAHIGDSRLYLLESNRLHKITADHTVVGQMLREGKITQAEAACHPQRNILTKAVGTKPFVRPDVFKIKRSVSVGSRFLLCSDGLYDLLSEEDIRRHLSKDTLRGALHSLIEQAKERGGYDNITATIVEINDTREFKKS